MTELTVVKPVEIRREVIETANKPNGFQLKKISWKAMRKLNYAQMKLQEAQEMKDTEAWEEAALDMNSIIAPFIKTVDRSLLIDDAPPDEEIDWSDPDSLDSYLTPESYIQLLVTVAGIKSEESAKN